ncbi:aminotransferase class V-fold PLP-dependent enzyme [soil metagenome]
MTDKPSRRDFLKTTAATAAVIGTAGPAAPVMGAAVPPTALDRSSIYTRKLGIKPVVNGVGVVTSLGGTIMPPEVVEAMVEASRFFIPFAELQEKVGERVASLLGVPAAMVSCGAASGITCATAACVAGGDVEKIRQLPDTAGMKNEIVQQKSHRSGYEAQMTLVGTKIIWVETRQELDAAINERTAMMFFLNKADPDGNIKRHEWIDVARQRGVFTFNDAASDVPPAERLWTYVREGFDLVAFSGGKGLLGPQATGFLLGRADLVRAAQHAISPHGGIGRGMKVGKEEMMGALAALERYLTVDHDGERKELDRRADHVLRALSGLPHVSAELYVPEIANRVPHVSVTWNETALGLSTQDLVGKLRGGDPPIWVSPAGEAGVRVSMWMLRGDEHELIASRLRDLLRRT